MFRDYISRPIDPIPESYFNAIGRINNEPDYSLSCLCVALLRPRIENYQGICGSYSACVEESVCVDEFLNNYGVTTNNLPNFYYYTYRTSGDKAELKARLEENGFKIKESIGTLMRDKTNTECIAVYHEEKNFAGIFINSRDIKYYHMLLSFISLLFPALFKDKPMEPKDFELVKSLSKNDKNVFIARIQEAIRPYTVEFRRHMLQRLLKNMHDQKVVRALNDVNSQRETVRYSEQEFSNAIEKLNQLIVLYEGLKATENYGEPEEDLIEYLSSNKRIHNLEIIEDNMSFTVDTLLNNYDEDCWRIFAEKGYIFDGNYNTPLLDAFKDVNNRKILLNSIFSESPEFAIKIAGNYSLNLNRARVTCTRNYDYNAADPVFENCLPNPHIKNFSCLGGYEHRVATALADRNYIGAVELCCASAGSVNLAETEQTFRPFIGWLMSSRNKVLRRRDGVEMTPEEALVYLIDKEKTE